ncbi:hypothetical protein CIPAW_10G164900 [Carya illinoinensis]|uniref:Uncharacterized protein n=1 Tax=Carya illinoinensis TaxID=32201 RepID=A0A8T1PF83_CARIL|nr:hypothetical protein CIPAW_10G164900 [Carya illinoinensis]
MRSKDAFIIPSRQNIMFEYFRNPNSEETQLTILNITKGYGFTTWNALDAGRHSLSVASLSDRPITILIALYLQRIGLLLIFPVLICSTVLPRVIVTTSIIATTQILGTTFGIHLG